MGPREVKEPPRRMAGVQAKANREERRPRWGRDGAIPRAVPPNLFRLGDHAADGGEGGACFGEFSLGAKRVGLVEEFIDLLGIG